MAEVKLENVNKRYGSTQVLFDVNIQAADGEFVVFVGPSGCGKSTLLRAIAGLEPIAGGAIHIGGSNVSQTPPSERGVAMVFQSYALYPHMSVRGNMAFGLKVNGLSKPEIAERIDRAARILQLEAYLNRRPGQLSGGQRQRVAIGRAIVKQPKVFLFDEPLSNLDAALRVQMRVELENLHSTLGSTMIYVTHDQVEAMTMADKIVVLNQGRVEQIGSPMELYRRPTTRFVAGFIGAPRMNFLPLSATDAGLSYHNSVIEMANGTPQRETITTLGIRPEHLTLLSDESSSMPTVAAQVRVVEALGSEAYVHADTKAGDRIVIRADADIALNRGEPVTVGIDPRRCHWFNRDGRALVGD